MSTKRARLCAAVWPGPSLTKRSGDLSKHCRSRAGGLLPQAKRGEEGAYAEVAHEVLLQSWGTLVAWLESEREFLSFKGRTELACARWIEVKQDRQALLSGLDLIQAEQWLATRERDFDPEDADFIRKSVAVRDADLAAAARFRRHVQRGTAFAAIAMTILSAFATWGWREADFREKEADLAKRQAYENAELAEASKQDFADFARYSRYSLNAQHAHYMTTIASFFDLVPSSYRQILSMRQASENFNSGDFEAARTVLKGELDNPSLLLQRSYMNIAKGNGDAAYSDASAAVQYFPREPAAIINVVISKAMIGDFISAAEYIESHINYCRRNALDITALDKDTVKITGGKYLLVRNTDFHLALLYFKAVLYAAASDDRFFSALDEADTYDLDYPFSRNVYLLSLAWLRFVKDTKTLNDKPEIGLHAGEAALWHRLEISRPSFHSITRELLKKIIASYKKKPELQNAKIYNWAVQQLQKKALRRLMFQISWVSFKTLTSLYKNLEPHINRITRP